MARDTYVGRMLNAVHLRDVGPVVVGKLRLDNETFHALVAHGAESHPVATHLLIDTGASHSFVERRVAQQLRLQPRRRETVRMADHKEFRSEVYQALLEVGLEGDGGSDMIAFPISLIGLPNPDVALPYQGLLGRDFLSRFGFAYHGPDGRFALRLNPEPFGTR